MMRYILFCPIALMMMLTYICYGEMKHSPPKESQCYLTLQFVEHISNEIFKVTRVRGEYSDIQWVTGPRKGNTEIIHSDWISYEIINPSPKPIDCVGSNGEKL